MTEYTLLVVKPDAVRAGLELVIFDLVVASGMHICHTRGIHPEDAPWADHYAEHASKHFYADLMAFVVSGPAVQAIVAGDDGVANLRRLIGTTDPFKAAPGTIRGDLKVHAGGGASNLVHASDSSASAARKLRLWFPDIDWDKVACD